MSPRAARAAARGRTTGWSGASPSVSTFPAPSSRASSGTSTSRVNAVRTPDSPSKTATSTIGSGSPATSSTASDTPGVSSPAKRRSASIRSRSGSVCHSLSTRTRAVPSLVELRTAVTPGMAARRCSSGRVTPSSNSSRALSGAVAVIVRPGRSSEGRSETGRRSREKTPSITTVSAPSSVETGRSMARRITGPSPSPSPSLSPSRWRGAPRPPPPWRRRRAGRRR